MLKGPKSSFVVVVVFVVFVVVVVAVVVIVVNGSMREMICG